MNSVEQFIDCQRKREKKTKLTKKIYALGGFFLPDMN
jgi:hypothetical protein